MDQRPLIFNPTLSDKAKFVLAFCLQTLAVSARLFSLLLIRQDSQVCVVWWGAAPGGPITVQVYSHFPTSLETSWIWAWGEQTLQALNASAGLDPENGAGKWERGMLKGQKHKEQRKGFSGFHVGVTFKLHRSSKCFHPINLLILTPRVSWSTNARRGIKQEIRKGFGA